MPIPTPIEPIHFSEPRGVQVRDPEVTTGVHSAVNGTINVYVDTRKEAELIIQMWPQIMTAAASAAQNILDSYRQAQSEQTS